MDAVTGHRMDEFTREPRVAYFSTEIALRSDIPTYAGGLGILAGDTIRSAADLGLPLIAVSLVSRRGYFRQEIDSQGQQTERDDAWDPSQFATSLDARVALHIEGRVVWIGAWLYVHESHLGGCTPVMLLDTDLQENHPDDRTITHHLYGGDERYRLKQEMVLGIGGVRLLHALGCRALAYHMNEGHSALLGLELLRQNVYPADDLRSGESPYDLPRVRDLCRFTTHTPLDAGHDRFGYGLVREVFRDSGSDRTVDAEITLLQSLGGDQSLNMTQLALSVSDFVNGVAKRHAEVSQKMFPGYRVRAITNGVHPFTWTCPAFAALYDHYVPGWCHEPELLAQAERIPAAALVAAHTVAKQTLIERVHALTGVTLEIGRPIVAFARRMTAYKRPELLFADLPRLRRIATGQPLQIVLAGKAHPHDEAGKNAIRFLHQQAQALRSEMACVFLPNYDMALAQTLVAGADVWLNTPLPPFEASGTSGMKAAFNGVPSLSIADGWWLEGCMEGITGWAIEDAATLYDKLEGVVLPLYYQADRAGWARVMLNVIAKNAAYFNSHRMMRRYATEAYLR